MLSLKFIRENADFIIERLAVKQFNAKEIVDSEEKRSIGLTFLRGDTIIFISPASMAKQE